MEGVWRETALSFWPGLVSKFGPTFSTIYFLAACNNL